MQTLDEAEFVDHLGCLRKQLRNPLAAIPMLCPFPRNSQDFAETIGTDQSGKFEWQWLSVMLIQQRLPVEGVHLAHSAVHEQKMTRLARGLRAGTRRLAAGQVRQGQAAKAAGCRLQEASTGIAGLTRGHDVTRDTETACWRGLSGTIWSNRASITLEAQRPVPGGNS